MSMTSDLKNMTNITNDILKKKKKKSYILYGYGYEGWFTLQIENGIKTVRIRVQTMSYVLIAHDYNPCRKCHC